MNRYSADEIKEAWGFSPKVAKRQAERAIPMIEEEISELKCELAVCKDVMGRDLDSVLPKAAPTQDAGNQQEYARGDEEDAGGVGSQQREPEPAKAS